MFWTEVKDFDCVIPPEVTLCGLLDVEIQELTNKRLRGQWKYWIAVFNATNIHTSPGTSALASHFRT